MRESFDTVAAALWASLGLPPPAAGQDTASLRIDGRSVLFVPSSSREHVVITTDVGRLSPDPFRREGQLRSLLRDALGLILTHRAALQRKAGTDGSVVEVVAVGPCRVGAVPALRERIEDLLHLADIHAGTLAPDGRTGKATEARRGEPFDAADSLIFRL